MTLVIVETWQRHCFDQSDDVKKAQVHPLFTQNRAKEEENEIKTLWIQCPWLSGDMSKKQLDHYLHVDVKH